MERLAAWLVRHPRRVIAATLLVTAVLGSFAVRVRFQSSFESVLPSGRSRRRVLRRGPQALRQRRRGRRRGAVRRAVLAVDAREDRARDDRRRQASGRGQRAQHHERHGRGGGRRRSPARSFPGCRRRPRTSTRCARGCTPYRSIARTSSRRTGGVPPSTSSSSRCRTPSTPISTSTGGSTASWQAEQGPERFYYTGAAHVKQAAVDLMRSDSSASPRSRSPSSCSACGSRFAPSGASCCRCQRS